MSTNAPGQLLGFSLQYPRALWHLLNCETEDKISMEVFGDVGVQKNDGSRLSEEDKSSQNKNPVTDRSKDLWKTFYNWTNAVVSGEISIQNTIFLLYANRGGKKSIVNSFHSCKDIEAAEKCIEEAWKKLEKISSKHEIVKYIDFLKKNHTIFREIVIRFEFQVGTSTGSEEVRTAIRKKHVSESQIEYIEHNLLGWLQRSIMEQLSIKQNAVITWKDFDVYARPVFESARRRELIDFTLQFPVEAAEVKKQKLERPPYIKQLEAIESEDDDILTAVSDYLKATTNRQKWIEQELLDEESAKQFEQKLQDFWKTQKKTVNITYASHSDEQKGQIVYQQCIARQQLIKNQDPPPATVSGTFHFLANCLSIGWHPNWQTKFNTKNKEDNE